MKKRFITSGPGVFSDEAQMIPTVHFEMNLSQG